MILKHRKREQCCASISHKLTGKVCDLSIQISGSRPAACCARVGVRAERRTDGYGWRSDCMRKQTLNSILMVSRNISHNADFRGVIFSKQNRKPKRIALDISAYTSRNGHRGLSNISHDKSEQTKSPGARLTGQRT